jgi:hypothetical protein
MKDYESAPHCMPMLTLLVKKKLKVLTPPWMELPSTHALQQVHSSGDPESASDRKPHHRKNPSWESRKNNTRQIQSSILLASFKMLQTTKQEHLHYPPSRFTRSGRLISRRLDFTAKHGLVWFPSCKKPAELQSQGCSKPLAASHIPKAQGQSSQDARCSSAGSQKNIGNKCSRFFSTLLALGTIVTIWPTKSRCSKESTWQLHQRVAFHPAAKEAY